MRARTERMLVAYGMLCCALKSWRLMRAHVHTHVCYSMISYACAQIDKLRVGTTRDSATTYWLQLSLPSQLHTQLHRHWACGSEISPMLRL